ncbi:acylphosphatase [Corynebacterium sp. H78]|uniref:acylphosphatase n=1 Tax=Corynebacterium sp. H78 TaxID=3133417 RepID=UPI00309984B7
MSETIRLTAWVHGHVQDVGFRWTTRSRALELGLVGFAKNYPDGRVLVVAEGSAEKCEELLAWLNGPDTPGVVETVVSDFSKPHGDYLTFDRR